MSKDKIWNLPQTLTLWDQDSEGEIHTTTTFKDIISNPNGTKFEHLFAAVSAVSTELSHDPKVRDKLDAACNKFLAELSGLMEESERD